MNIVFAGDPGMFIKPLFYRLRNVTDLIQNRQALEKHRLLVDLR